MQETWETGIGSVLSYDNIAIVVLFIIAACLAGFNFLQFRQRNKTEKEYMETMMVIRDALHKLSQTITVLNERIGHK